MDAKELADKFNAKTEAAVAERHRQSDLASGTYSEAQRGYRALQARHGGRRSAVPHGTGSSIWATINSPLRRRSTCRITSRSASRSRLAMEERPASRRRSETSSSPAPATAEQKGASHMSTRLTRSPLSQIRATSRGTRSPNWSKWSSTTLSPEGPPAAGALAWTRLTSRSPVQRSPPAGVKVRPARPIRQSVAPTA